MREKTGQRKLIALLVTVISIIAIVSSTVALLVSHSVVAQADTGNAVITSVQVKNDAEHIIDGTASFDTDDEPGDDSGAFNKIVRSFDNIYYTIDYTTGLVDETKTVDSANIECEFTLPFSPTVARFVPDDMAWLLDATTTYYYSDGTSSTTYDSSKTVTKQVLNGYRHLENTATSVSVPGTGTLFVSVYVNGAVNGTEIQPTFKVWVEGTASTTKTTQPEKITVSSAPKYDIALYSNGNAGQLVYFDFDSGKMSGADSADATKGRMFGYSVELRLYNDSADKGMKGIEMPTGSFDIDISFTETVTEQTSPKTVYDGTEMDDWKVRLWDYREHNRANGTSAKGTLGRMLCANGKSLSTYMSEHAAFNSYPGQLSTNRQDTCYQGGKFNIVETGTGKIHITVDDYGFNPLSLSFPKHYAGVTDASIGYYTYPANIGAFSCAYFEVCATVPRSVTVDTSGSLNARIDSFSAVTPSGTITTETNVSDTKSNNSTTNSVQVLPSGSHNKFCQFTGGSAGETSWGQSNGTTYQGAAIGIRGTIQFGGDLVHQSVNNLIKFEDTAFEILESNSGYSTSYSNSLDTRGTTTQWFAAKPDKSGWKDLAEMQDTHEEQLLFFKSLSALKDAGYTCVGVLFETRNAVIYPGDNSVAYSNTQNINVKDTAIPGNVYCIINDTRCWTDNASATSWEEYPNSTASGAYGLGDASWTYSGDRWSTTKDTYATGYTVPDCHVYNPVSPGGYTRRTYSNGVMTGGHNGGNYYGHSVLVLGDKTSVKVYQTDSTFSSEKKVYDLDNGERTAYFKLAPCLYAANGSAGSTGKTDDLVVTTTLTKGLTYDANSASVAPTTVTVNSDGTTTLVWNFADTEIGTTLKPVTFTCTIGAAATPNDVNNNDTLTVSAVSSASQDQRAYTTANGNTSSATISVIRLASAALYKSVSDNLTEVGQGYSWNISYGVSSDQKAEEVQLLDVLPYDGDSRGSSFGGKYYITGITSDYATAPKTAAENTPVIAYTTSTVVRTATLSSVYDGTAGITWTTATPSGGTWTVPDNTTALMFTLGTVEGNEYLSFTLDIAKPYRDTSGNIIMNAAGEKQEPGDIYANSFSENMKDQATVVQSNVCSTQVVNRVISGKAWNDNDRNGTYGSGDSAVSGNNVSVSLYRTSASPNHTSDSAVSLNLGGTTRSLYPAYNLCDTTAIASVKTGADGTYSFPYLESGDYVIVFVYDGTHFITARNVSTDDTVDSDASVTISANRMVNGFIEQSLPGIESMGSYYYESANNDVGYYTLSEKFNVNKTDSLSGATLSGATFTLTDESGNKSTITGNSTSGELMNGSYQLSESVAPTGYILDTTSHTVVVDYSATYGTDGNGVYSSSLTIDGKDTDTLTVADVSQKTSLIITKKWDDDSNRDGLRKNPSFTVTGTVGTTTVTTVTKSGTTADNNTVTFADLPCYYNGVAVSYAVAETDMTGYTATIGALEGNATDGYSTTVTNTHAPAQKTITAKKVWDDNNNQDGSRPTYVEVVLTGTDGSELTQKIMAPDASTSFTVPVYTDGGKTITYNISENECTGYTSAITGNETDGYTITNSHTPAVKSIDGSKVWVDDDNQDGVRPASINVSLYADGVKVLTKEVTGSGNSWSWSFTDVPEYKSGKLITYTVDEDSVPTGYEKKIEGTTITNTHKSAVTSVSVTKVWDDTDDNDGLRKAPSFTVTGTVGSTTVNTFTKTGTIDNNAVVSFTDLPGYHSGKEISYSVSEATIDGYTTTLGTMTGNMSDGYAVTVTNNHEIEKKTISATKVWDDNDNQDGVRPLYVAVVLTGDNGTKLTNQILTPATSTTFTVPLYYNHGTEIKYTLTENECRNYTTAITGNEKTGYTITNTHTPEETSVSGVKKWNDNDNQDGLRPSSVTVSLYADGTKIASKDVSGSGNSWSWSFANLPKYKNGKLISYTVDEDNVPTGYTKSVNGTTIMNTHEPEITSMTVNKKWDDAYNQDGKRPQSVSVTLKGSNGSTSTVTLNKDNVWSHTFANLPVYYNNGTEITYTVEEAAVSGYTGSIAYSGTTATITNTHTPATTTLTVQKVWDDNDDQDGQRSKEISFAVTGSDGSSWTGTLNESGGWKATKTVPVYYNGAEITYSAAETSTADGYAASVVRSGSAASGWTFKITNTHSPAVTSLSVNKVWDDNDDQDGIRPASITVKAIGTNGYSKEITLDRECDWSASINNLPVYDDGVPIAYSVEEEDVPEGYERTIACNSSAWSEGFSFTVTNTHEPETKNISVSKIWDDADDQDGIRPSKISVSLEGSDGTKREATITADEKWMYEFTDLPVYDDGDEIEYAVSENAVDGYECDIEENEDGFTLTNKHVPETFTLSIVKTWDDANNAAGIRPAEIEVSVQMNGAEKERVTLTAHDDWKFELVDLDQYASGQKIEYSVEEVPVGGYTSASELNGTTATIINYHEYAPVLDNTSGVASVLVATGDVKLPIAVLGMIFVASIIAFLRKKSK